MKKTLLTLLIPTVIGCGNPGAYADEFMSNIDIPVGEVASEMTQDIRARNFGDAVSRPGEHSYRLGGVSASQEKMYRAGVAEDTHSVIGRAKSCYHDGDCLPSWLGKYFVDWEER